MSGALSLATGNDSALSYLSPVLFNGTRAIGFVIPDVVFSEEHRDELVVTEHPVEQGAAISDHAFKRPVEVSIRAGWSDSTAGVTGYAQLIYGALLTLQGLRTPFPIVTRRRLYQNMLMTSLGLTTDGTSENCLMVSASFKEVIIVQTAVTTLPPQENQADPARTASPVDSGAKQLGPEQTTLRQMKGAPGYFRPAASADGFVTGGI